MHTMSRTLLLGALALALADAPALGQGGAAPTSAAPSAEAPRSQPIRLRAFHKPEEGFAALAEAARTHNERELLRLLGEAGRALIRSGDPVADRAARDKFATEYAEKQEILLPAPDRAVLQVGNDEWPLPIPMVQRGGFWRFDARLGAQELVDRRIGRNELDTIETLRAIVDAQDEFARSAGRAGAFRTYARRFFSTPGQRDGLYWPTAEGEPPSPLGPLVAAASAGGYARRGDAPTALHGYYFRILESQGPSAPGGAFDFVVNGKMIGGFGVIAHPAQYGASGIMTFIVSHEDVVYQRDLGPNTERIARGITRFDPGEGWEAVEE